MLSTEDNTNYKTALRFHLNPVKVVKIKKTTAKDAGKEVEKGEPLSLLVTLQTSAVSIEINV